MYESTEIEPKKDLIQTTFNQAWLSARRLDRLCEIENRASLDLLDINFQNSPDNILNSFKIRRLALVGIYNEILTQADLKKEERVVYTKALRELREIMPNIVKNLIAQTSSGVHTIYYHPEIDRTRSYFDAVSNKLRRLMFKKKIGTKVEEDEGWDL